MSLRNKEANPLAVFNMRRMDFCPPHFETVKFDLRVTETQIANWLYENTEGRFYLGQAVNESLDSPALCECAGFEVHSEATYFSMFLNQLNTISDEIF